MRITFLIFLLLTLSLNTAWAGVIFKVSDKITYVSVLPNWDDERISDWSTGGHIQASSAIEIKDFLYNPVEYIRRQKLLKKIDEIQRQFEEAERLAYIGLSKEEIEEMYRKAVEVLNGAMVVNHSEVIYEISN